MKMQLALATTKQQQTSAFFRWFKHSKVVDKDYKPLRVYHGTKHEFKEFSRAHHGKQDFGYLGEGFYFTASHKIASSYGTAGEGGHILPVYLSLQNPYIIDKHNWQRTDQGYSRVVAISQELQQKGENFTKANAHAAKQYRQELEDAGYDGIIDDSDGAMTQIVAFYPNQIKSAIGNSGYFDLHSDELTD